MSVESMFEDAQRARVKEAAPERRCADLIYLLMTEHSLSREDVARILHVSIHTVDAWFKPSRPQPSMAMAELMCLKLGAPVPEWLKSTDC